MIQLGVHFVIASQRDGVVVARPLSPQFADTFTVLANVVDGFRRTLADHKHDSTKDPEPTSPTGTVTPALAEAAHRAVKQVTNVFERPIGGLDLATLGVAGVATFTPEIIRLLHPLTPARHAVDTPGPSFAQVNAQFADAPPRPRDVDDEGSSKTTSRLLLGGAALVGVPLTIALWRRFTR